VRLLPSGTLTVNADPWGNVSINERLIGATPQVGVPLRPGRYRVTVENPKLGRRSYPVLVRPGKNTKVVVSFKPPIP
jgi:hypothetical protein